ncbi:MAG: thermonuclease family protein [Burkholderiales bacterium]|jgi:endonuclease YncB( thermonuclease family)|nr:thermonuclease family protein [Burkholderiales bacterium]MBK6714315.1 thermonuclease family protein [Burkholderiales bacterium]MBP7519403.1 thermonuclease family protein [Leptothrix sp. (in: b-proteobacteria)]
MVSLLLCWVLSVSDGDTLRVSCPAEGHRVVQVLRLSGIDAPERGQPWGAHSRRQLQQLCHRREAEIVVETQDRWGRQVARVRCAGVDAGQAQVRAGLAWVYERYSDDAQLLAWQVAAKDQRRGLWADPAPVPPWEWRARHRAASSAQPDAAYRRQQDVTPR